MDFKLNKEAKQVADIIENGKKFRRLLWGVVVTAGLFGVASVINAVKWW